MTIRIARFEKKIIALTAQIDQMQRLLKGTKFKLQKNSKNSFNPNSKNKKPFAPKQKSKKEMEAWKRIPPKEGESHSKKIKGKDFNWCTEHWLGIDILKLTVN